MSEQECLLKVQNVSKSFPGVRALDNISFRVSKGSVHALVGENGAGKSTLMKILLGLYHPDTGKIYFNGEKKHFYHPKDALNAGIAMIHQELSCARELTVAQNIFLAKELTLKHTQFLDKKRMIEQSYELLQRIGIDNIDPNTKIKDLSVAKQQMCEIAKAISYNAALILMDEPTAAIPSNDVLTLFEIIRALKKEGKTIIYVTHKLEEIFEIADKVSVFRNGMHVDTIDTSATNKDALIQMMVGRDIVDLYAKEKANIGDVVLQVENLSCSKKFDNVSFTLKKGEILGVAGLVGAGRSEIMETLFGIRQKKTGKIFISGKEVNIRSPRDAIKNGLAFLTEDRKNSGCFLPLSVRINTYIASIKQHSGRLFVRRKKTVESTKQMIDALSIKVSSMEDQINNLSGGNQQKVLVARWLLTEPEILIVDEPTRGIDVGAKAEVHRLLVNLALKGKAIIMISSEMSEILAMSDRIMTVSSGRVTGFIDAKEATQEKILKCCMD
jgi:ABC-type sugar transport system ATPase subunit